MRSIIIVIIYLELLLWADILLTSEGVQAFGREKRRGLRAAFCELRLMYVCLHLALENRARFWCRMEQSIVTGCFGVSLTGVVTKCSFVVLMRN